MRKDRFKLAFTGNDLPLFIAGSGVDVGVKGFKLLWTAIRQPNQIVRLFHHN